MTYRPQAVRRLYIPKPGSDKERPLGILAHEDKIVQLAVSKILTAIYEQDFLDSSYGFRPGRSCHDALRKSNNIIMTGKANWIVDADISGFFDHVDHGWMMKWELVKLVPLQVQQPVLRCTQCGELIKHSLFSGVSPPGLHRQCPGDYRGIVYSCV